MKNFVLIGAGFVAPRHAQAIKDVGGDLVAFTDPYDNVGWMDKYFSGAKYFKEFERFDRFVDLYTRDHGPINYVSICSPNYLHDAHIRWALKNNADAICEKPLVCHYHNLEGLSELEVRTGRRVWNILQLRLDRKAMAAKLKYSNGRSDNKVRVFYNIRRGQWYNHSWKADVEKSGGIVTNIGVHLFDLLFWLFGRTESYSCCEADSQSIFGTLQLERANVEWQLSINMHRGAMRVFEINGKEMDLSDGIENLHTKSYEQILKGEGFGIKDASESIKICEGIRNYED